MEFTYAHSGFVPLFGALTSKPFQLQNVGRAGRSKTLTVSESRVGVISTRAIRISSPAVEGTPLLEEGPGAVRKYAESTTSDARDTSLTVKVN